MIGKRVTNHQLAKLPIGSSVIESHGMPTRKFVGEFARQLQKKPWRAVPRVFQARHEMDLLMRPGVRCRALHALRVLRLRLEFAGEYPMSGSHRKGACPEP